MTEHTALDYSTKYKLAKIFGQIDSGELAARTGGLSFLDRRGNVVFMDDFSNNTNNYYRSSAGAASAMVISATRSFSNDTCMKITAGPGATNYTNVWRTTNQPRSTKLGVEVMYMIDNDDADIMLGISGWTGTEVYDAWIKYDTGTEEISYHNLGGTFTVIGTERNELEVYKLWTYFKVVIDWSTKCYVRAIVGGTEYPLPNIEFYHTASGLDPMTQLLMHITVNGATTTDLYADNLIFTQNEP